MNLYFNLVLVCLTILIIVLCNTEYFLVDETDKSKKLKKMVGASNEGSSVLNTCESCTYEKNAQACLDNVQIMEDNYCPKILQCNGMPEIPNSKTLQNPSLMGDNIQSITKQLESLSKLKNKNNNKTNKKACDKILCYIKNNPEIQERYSEFNSIYEKINNKINGSKTQIGLITLDFLNDSDENVSNMKQFLINPMNIYYFDLPGVIYEVKNNGLTLTSKTKDEIINRTSIPDILVKKAFENIGTYVDGSDGKYKIKISGNQVEDIPVPSHILNLGLEQMIQFSKEIYSCSRYINEIEC